MTTCPPEDVHDKPTVGINCTNLLDGLVHVPV